MIYATGMDVHLKPRIFPYEPASSRSVIEVNVREKDCAQVTDGYSLLLQPLPQCVNGGCGTRVDERAVILKSENGARNRARMAGPMKINGSNRMHAFKSLTQAALEVIQ